MNGIVIAVNSAKKRGVIKKNVRKGYLKKGWGLVGDAHAGDWDRQISILPIEAMELVPPAIMSTLCSEDYTENITIEGIPLRKLEIGKQLRIGDAEVSICHIGKEKPKDEGRPYIVSREGRFGIITKSGRVKVGDPVTFLEE
jgi:MOSC domain-containing protein YiiM